MILNRNYYVKASKLKSRWISQKLQKIAGEKVLKIFRLHKTVWPDKLYFYSPRLKRVPKFTGDLDLLLRWQEAKLCENICPTQAIKVTPKAFIIDEQGCISCGLCVELAPPGILEYSSDQPGIHRS